MLSLSVGISKRTRNTLGLSERADYTERKRQPRGYDCCRLGRPKRRATPEWPQPVIVTSVVNTIRQETSPTDTEGRKAQLVSAFSTVPSEVLFDVSRVRGHAVGRASCSARRPQCEKVAARVGMSRLVGEGECVSNGSDAR